MSDPDSDRLSLHVVETDRRRKRIESAFLHGFRQIVDGLDFAQVAVPPRGSQVPRRRTLDRFSLAPLVGDSYPTVRRSLPAAGYNFQLPEGVTSPNKGLIHGDRMLMIGLVFDSVLCALSSAYVPRANMEADVMISQLQGCISVTGADGYYNPDHNRGLHSGVAWRHTLTQAWIRTAEQVGAGVVGFTSAERNVWAGPLGATEAEKRRLAGEEEPPSSEWRAIGIELLRPGNDQVAQDCGFTQMPDKNWQLTLQAQATDA